MLTVYIYSFNVYTVQKAQKFGCFDTQRNFQLLLNVHKQVVSGWM